MVQIFFHLPLCKDIICRYSRFLVSICVDGPNHSVGVTIQGSFLDLVRCTSVLRDERTVKITKRKRYAKRGITSNKTSLSRRRSVFESVSKGVRREGRRE